MANFNFGPDLATIDVFVDKEGLFAAAGHDLQLRVARFQLSIDTNAGQVETDVDAASLVVLHALRDGVPQPGALDDADRARIEASIRTSVFETSRHPTIAFRSIASSRTPTGFHVAGRLTMHGTTQPLAFDLRREDGRLVAEVALDQRSFGIKPFSAVMGTLRVKPVVRVRLRVPEVEPR